MKRFGVLSSKKGFTLVELLISMVLMVLVGTLVFYFSNTTISLFKKNTDSATLQDQARIIALGLRNELRTATGNLTIDDGSTELYAGQSAFSVEDGRVNRRDYGSAPYGAYSTESYDTLSIVYSYDAAQDNILHVVISIEGAVRSESDIYLLNGSAAGATAGNVLIFTPAQ